ncbi:MAG: HEAT repeat domain-containing protein [Fibrobacterota bacterium]
MKQRIFTGCFIFMLLAGVAGKTRRSTLRTVPDADFIGGGALQGGYSWYLYEDTAGERASLHQGDALLGISEFMNVGVSWTGTGASLSLKGRLLDEYSGPYPSVALGVRDMYTSSTLSRIGESGDTPDRTGEVFLAFSKSYEPATLRFHGGITSLPYQKGEAFNLFIALEKYLGSFFYMTLEGWSLRDRFHTAFSSTLRFLPENRGEFVFEVVDLASFLTDEHGSPRLGLTRGSDKDWVVPGLSLGFSFYMPTDLAQKPSFRTLENLYSENRDDLQTLRKELPQLRENISRMESANTALSSRVDSLSQRFESTDSLLPEYRQVRSMLRRLTALYRSEPVDYQKIRSLRDQFSQGDSTMQEMILRVLKNEDEPQSLRMQAAAVTGLIKMDEAVAVLLDILAENPPGRFQVELIVSLGLIGDTSVRYALENLARSDDPSVAAAAREVLYMWDSADIPAGYIETQSEFSVEDAYMEDSAESDSGE